MDLVTLTTGSKFFVQEKKGNGERKREKEVGITDIKKKRTARDGRTSGVRMCVWWLVVFV